MCEECKRIQKRWLTINYYYKVTFFKSKIKPILGRSFKDEELENIKNLKGKEFEEIIKKKFNEFRKKRSKILTETANL